MFWEQPTEEHEYDDTDEADKSISGADRIDHEKYNDGDRHCHVKRRFAYTRPVSVKKKQLFF